MAAIDLRFDPLIRLGDLAIRWQAVGVTAALLAAFAVAAARTRLAGPLRPADLAVILVGIVPGAVVGGRVVHALAFWDAYAADPVRVLDPAVGGLSLAGAVLGGLASGAYVAQLLGAPVVRWMDAAATPMLLALGLGKLAQLLGGSGQGAPFDGPWAVAFPGTGPWVAANAEVPSHPAQVYEGLWMLFGIALVAWVARRAPPGLPFAAALGWFLAGRVVIGFTWRDERVLGLLNVEQMLALVTLGLMLAAVGWRHPRYRSPVRLLRELRGPTT